MGDGEALFDFESVMFVLYDGPGAGNTLGYQRLSRESGPNECVTSNGAPRFGGIRYSS